MNKNTKPFVPPYPKVGDLLSEVEGLFEEQIEHWDTCCNHLDGDDPQIPLADAKCEQSRFLRTAVRRILSKHLVQAITSAEKATPRASPVDSIPPQTSPSVFKSACTLGARHNFHPRTLHRWAREGKICAYKVNGRTVRYDEAEILRFMSGGRRTGWQQTKAKS